MPYRHVISVYDGTPGSEDLLEMACNIVRAQHAQLTILHVRLVPLTQPLPSYEPGADAEIDAVVRKAEEFAEKRGVKPASAVRFARTLGGGALTEARLRGADLLALTAPSREDIQSRGGLDTDVDIVLRRAACAVLLLRPRG